MKKWFVGLVLIFVLVGVCLAESEGPKDWIGKDVIFLAKPPSLQEYRYFYTYKKNDMVNYSIPYKDLVGKQAKIIEVGDTDSPEISLKLDDNVMLYCKAIGGTLDDVCFKSELDNAKKYIGQTIWSDPHIRILTYIIDQKSGEVADFDISNLEKLNVMNVEPSFNDYAPLRFALKRANGKLIFWDGSYSLINDTSNHLLRPFNKSWSFLDPKKLHPKWTQKTWNAIKQCEIFIGMNKDMVLMSWGKPEKVNSTIIASGKSEQWIYGDQYVYFDKGLVSAIQSF